MLMLICWGWNVDTIKDNHGSLADGLHVAVDKSKLDIFIS